MAAIIYEYNGAGEPRTGGKKCEAKKEKMYPPRYAAPPRGLASGPELTIFRVSSGLARGKIQFSQRTRQRALQ